MKKITKICKLCNKETPHRFTKDGKYPYYRCSFCSERCSKKHRKNNWSKYLAQKANARKRPNSEKMTGTIVEDLIIKQNNKCALSGITFDINSRWWKPSLDRIDSNKGYTVDNIRIVTWMVNHSKGILTDDEFNEMCRCVYEYQQNQQLITK